MFFVGITSPTFNIIFPFKALALVNSKVPLAVVSFSLLLENSLEYQFLLWCVVLPPAVRCQAFYEVGFPGVEQRVTDHDVYQLAMGTIAAFVC